MGELRCWALVRTRATLGIFLACIVVGNASFAAAATTEKQLDGSGSGSQAGAHTMNAADCGERFAVSFHEHQADAVLQQLRDQGYTIHTVGHGFAAVSKCLSTAAGRMAAAAQEGQQLLERRGLLESVNRMVAAVGSSLQRRRHLRALSGTEGVHAAEPDVLRYFNRPEPSSPAPPSPTEGNAGFTGRLSLLARRVLRAAFGGARGGRVWAHGSPPPSPYSPWDLDQTTCSLKDRRLDDFAGGETMPWGIAAVQGNTTLVPAKTAGTGVTVCVIDSGVWGKHPDLQPNNLAGCGMDRAPRGGVAGEGACPYRWDEDLVGHGTHVSGTIGAMKNGQGVVGVIPGGADIYVVRIWDTTGDVSQGEGIYASDLVRAYAACEARLDRLIRDKGAAGQKQRMVVSMSFGSAGPLTVERMFFQRAAKRDDMLFVASSGNNGSDWGSLFAPPNSDQWLSYPASYDTANLLSVANVDCKGSVADSSQRNQAVDIAAPGTAVLSSVPDEYKYVRGDVRVEGVGARTKGAPRYPEPRPIQDADVSSTKTPLPLADCYGAAAGGGTPPEGPRGGGAAEGASLLPPCAKAAGGGVCLIGLPGRRDTYEEACTAMLACIDGGGRALVVWRGPDLDEYSGDVDDAKAEARRDGRDASTQAVLAGMRSDQRRQQQDMGMSGDSGYEGPSGMFDDFDREILPGARLNCGMRCECWNQLQKRLKNGKRVLPAVFVGKRQAYDILEAVQAKAVKGAPMPRANVTVFDFPYRHFDGTSMAAPHVAGGAARVWVDFPKCSATELARALKESAKKLDGAQPNMEGAGLLQVEAAYLKLESYSCARA